MKINPTIHLPDSQNVIGELLSLSQLCHGEQDVNLVLDKLVEKIALIMRGDVCSLYIIDPRSHRLVLRATQGLNKKSVGQVSLLPGEGLVGKAAEWMKPVSVASAKRSKSFKFIPGTGEEKYLSLLAVPLIYNLHPIGVLVIQNEKVTRYSEETVHLLMTLAIPTVNVIERAKLIGTLDFAKADKTEGSAHPRAQGLMHMGIGSSSGIAMAKVKVVGKRKMPVVSQHIEPAHVDVEKMRLLEAIRWVEEEIRYSQAKAAKKFGMEEIAIFEAYQTMLESAAFRDQILAEIDQGRSALGAVSAVVSHYSDELNKADDDYIRERAYDIEDLGRKISDRLLYGSNVPRNHHELEEDAILLADFWSISDLVEMDLEHVKGILSPAGGASSHVAILAQSLEIPAVLGLGTFTNLVHENDDIIMDGSSGVVLVNPNDDVRTAYARENEGQAKSRKKYMKYAHRSVKGDSGKKIAVGANVGMVAHVKSALEHGAEEIGLYRTEFPFMIKKSLPTEEEQALLYTRILQAMGKKPVTIRTLDIGGDKYLPYLNLPEEENPSLGWRSIRISLDREDLFRIQLKALLRASVYGKLRILFPMISSVEEIRKVKAIFKDVKKELKSKKIRFVEEIPCGIMIEVPSAVFMAETLIREVDFFSVGTNDLIQYTLAVDRNNAKVADMFDPLHPAVLKSISHVVKAAHRAKKPVNVCGEMAAQPLCVLILVGMGVDGISLSAPLIPLIKKILTSLTPQQMRSITQHVLHLETGDEIYQYVANVLKKLKLGEYVPLNRRLAGAHH